MSSGARGVTVIIPVWGRAAGSSVATAVATARDQGVTDIVVVDNCSDEPLPDIAGARLIRTPRRVSLGATRNEGLAAATTELVLFLDADDALLPGSLDVLTTALDDDPALVACAPSILDARTGMRSHWPRPATFPLTRHPTAFAFVNAISSLYPTSGAVVRTAAARDAGGFPDAEGGEDWAFGASLALRGRIRIVHEMGRLYARRPDSLSSGWTRSHLVRHARLVRRQLRNDPATPRLMRAALPAVAAAQYLVVFVVRPVARLRRPG